MGATVSHRAVFRIAAVACALGAMLFLSALAAEAQAATPTFVQTSAKEVTSGTTNSLAFSSANTAGNLIVAYVIWSNTGTVDAVRQHGATRYVERGRAHDLGQQLELAGLLRQERRRRREHRDGHVRATRSTRWAVVYIHEYSGVDKVSPVDASADGHGHGQRRWTAARYHDERERPAVLGRRVERTR